MPSEKITAISELAENLIKTSNMDEDTAIKLASICYDNNLIQLNIDSTEVKDYDWEDIIYALMRISKKVYGDAVLYNDTQKADNDLPEITTMFTQTDLAVLKEASTILKRVRASIFDEAEKLNEDK